MDRVYAVIGVATYLDCTSTWVVAVYPHEETAVQHADLARRYVHCIEDNPSLFDSRESIWRAILDTPYDNIPRDLGLDADYRVDYEVQEAPFALHVDDYQERRKTC